LPIQAKKANHKNRPSALCFADRITAKVMTREDGAKYLACSDGLERAVEFQKPHLGRIRELLNQRALARGETNTLEYWQGRPEAEARDKQRSHTLQGQDKAA
jgi:hypothetical protein